MHFRYLLLVCFYIVFAKTTLAQTNLEAFKASQLSQPRVQQAMNTYQDTIKKYFTKKNLKFPPKDIYLRSFKYQNELELWARDTNTEEYKLVKTYRVCALSGLLGPKQYEGDRQVPEGFYFIDQFNPHSEYYLSMLISYPNLVDRTMSNSPKLGGNIYIHGGCVTVGCIPMTDVLISQLYVTCLMAKLNGQENIPIHIYPTRFNKSAMSYLYVEFKNDPFKQKFWNTLKKYYDYFELYHKLKPLLYTNDGNYL